MAASFPVFSPLKEHGLKDPESGFGVPFVPTDTFQSFLPESSYSTESHCLSSLSLIVVCQYLHQNISPTVLFCPPNVCCSLGDSHALTGRPSTTPYFIDRITCSGFSSDVHSQGQALHHDFGSRNSKQPIHCGHFLITEMTFRLIEAFYLSL